jgi:ABC-type glutathione transport system ATPase component
MSAAVLEAVGISRSFRRGMWPGKVRRHAALTDVSLTLAPGEIVGLVGESGSGKTTFGRIVAGLETADAGTLAMDGRVLAGPGVRAVKPGRRGVGMVFQDPQAALNPRMRALEIVAEGLRIAGTLSRTECRARAEEALRFVGLRAEDGEKYPAQFSGGQRQRLGIARALVLRPRLLIADEAVSSLDVSVQMQVLNLLLDVRAQFGLSILMITHNIAVVAYLCDRVAVLAQGRIVEHGAARSVLGSPHHPYTQRLLQAVPQL